MFTSSKKNPSLSWVDCLSGAKGTLESLPAALPGDTANPALSVIKLGETLALEPSQAGTALVNGAPLRQRLILTETTTVQLPTALLVIAPAEQADFHEVQTDNWIIFDALSGDQLGEYPPQRLLD